jgi:UDP-glucuronate decarboxylase
LTGSKSKLRQLPLPADDPQRRRPDITLAKERLGWSPTIRLQDGLEKTIEWFRTIDVEHFRPPTPNY